MTLERHVIKRYGNLSILFVPDMHLTGRNTKIQRNALNMSTRSLYDLLSLVIEHQVDIVIYLGDLFDGAYDSTEAMITHTMLIKAIAKHAESFIVLGNHEEHAKVNKMPLWTLTDEIKSIRLQHIAAVDTYKGQLVKRPSGEAILKMPDCLVINDTTTINFIHHSDHVKDFDYVKNQTTINLYHSHTITEPIVQMIKSIKENPYIPMEAAVTKDHFHGVDLAIFGDIHEKLGSIRLTHFDDSHTMTIMPGTMRWTSRGAGEQHNTVDLPLLRFEDGKISQRLLTYEIGNIHREYLGLDSEAEAVKKKLHKEIEMTLQAARNTLSEKFDEFLEQSSLSSSAKSFGLSVLNVEGKPNWSGLLNQIRNNKGE